MEALSLAITLKAIDNMTRPLRQIERQAKEVAEAVKEIEKKLNVVDKTAIKVAGAFDKLALKIRAAKEPFRLIREQTEALKNWSQGMLIKGTAVLGVSVVPTIAATNFEEALAEVSTLTDMSLEEFKAKYAKGVLDLSKELGSSPVEVARAMYQAISAGIAPEKALEFIKTAGKAAIAGKTDIFTATDTLTSMVNAFKQFGYTTKEISDFVFVAVREGKTTFSEIAGSIGQVANIAATAGVSLEESLAAMSALTAGGMSTSEAFTGVKYAIESLLNPTSQAEEWFQKLGVQVDANTLKQYGLKGTLEILTKAVQRYTKNEAQQKKILAEVFSSVEALNAVLGLTGAQAEKFNDILKKMGKSAGATDEAYEKMARTTAFQLRQMKATMQVLAVTAGSFLLPAMNSVLSTLKAILSPIAGLMNRFPTLTKVILGAVIGFGALMFTLGALGLAISMTINGLIALRTAILAFRAISIVSLGPVGIIITAIALGALLLIRLWGPVKNFFKSLWSGVVSAFSGAWNWIKTSWNKLMKLFLWTNPITAPIMAFRKLTGYLKSVNLFEAGKKIIETLWQGIKSVALKPVEAIKSITQKIRNFLPFSPAKEGPLKDLHLTGVRLVQTIAQNISPEPVAQKLNSILSSLPLPFPDIRSLMMQEKRIVPGPASATMQTSTSVTVNISAINVYGTSKAEAVEVAKTIEDQVRLAIEKIARERWRRIL